MQCFQMPASGRPRRGPVAGAIRHVLRVAIGSTFAAVLWACQGDAPTAPRQQPSVPPTPLFDGEFFWSHTATLTENTTECSPKCYDVHVSTGAYNLNQWSETGYDYTLIAMYNEGATSTWHDEESCQSGGCMTDFQVPANCDVQKVDLALRTNGWVVTSSQTYRATGSDGATCGTSPNGGGGTQVDRMKDGAVQCWEVWLVWPAPSYREIYMGDWCAMT